jgi:hypothetical protein
MKSTYEQSKDDEKKDVEHGIDSFVNSIVDASGYEIAWQHLLRMGKEENDSDKRSVYRALFRTLFLERTILNEKHDDISKGRLKPEL